MNKVLWKGTALAVPLRSKIPGFSPCAGRAQIANIIYEISGSLLSH
jgi:hypothetical protein